ncbi:MAG: DNA adenine methylase, partial [Magnetospirillum sp. WYHS-4]
MPSFSASAISPRLRAFPLSMTLSQVSRSRMPYGDFIARYDRNETLFYLDPPPGGRRATTARTCSAGIKGAFLMSINDIPEVRALFSRFHVQAVETTYTIGGGD